VRLRVAILSTLLPVALVAATTAGLAESRGHAAKAPSARPAGTRRFRWQRVVTASAPSVRISAPIAYDPATRQVVLIGGVRTINPKVGSPAETETVLGDTWVFIDGDWSQMISGPTPPIGDSPDVLAYDPGRKALFLVTAPAFVAGTARLTQPSTTWAWTGSHWSELLGSGPHWGTATTASALLAYDAATHQLVFAPAGGPSTYVLGESGWLSEPKPPRLMTDMAYDPAARRLVGQTETSGSMWWWTGKRWQLLERHVVVRLHAGSAYGMFVESANWVTDEAAGELIVFGYTAETTVSSVHTPNPPDLFAWIRGTWRPIEAKMNPVPENPQNFSLAYDGSIGGVVAFGGGSGEFTSSGVPCPASTTKIDCPNPGYITGGNNTWKLVRSQ
jgi:hypothetical protein